MLAKAHSIKFSSENSGAIWGDVFKLSYVIKK
jgi:hypothetical protein